MKRINSRIITVLALTVVTVSAATVMAVDLRKMELNEIEQPSEIKIACLHFRNMECLKGFSFRKMHFLFGVRYANSFKANKNFIDTSESDFVLFENQNASLVMKTFIHCVNA